MINTTTETKTPNTYSTYFINTFNATASITEIKRKEDISYNVSSLLSRLGYTEQEEE